MSNNTNKPNRLIMNNMRQAIHEQDVGDFLWQALALFQDQLAKGEKTTFSAKDISIFCGHIMKNDHIRRQGTTSEQANVQELAAWIG